MTARCDLGYDVDAVFRAAAGDMLEMDAQSVLAHAERCDVCSGRLGALRVVRLGWDDAVAETPRAARRRNARAARRFEERRRPSRAPASRIALGLAFAALVAVLAVTFARKPNTEAPLASSPSASIAPPPVIVASAPPPRIPTPRAIITRACSDCRAQKGGAVNANVSLEAAGAIDVPRSSSLTFAFAFDDEGAMVVVDGPARVVADTKGVRLEHGRASVTAPGTSVLTTPAGTISGAKGRWTIVVDDTGARVDVETGQVRVDTPSERIEAGANEHVEVGARGVTKTAARDEPRRSPPPAPAAPASIHVGRTPVAQAATAKTVEMRWAEIRRAVDAGERALAESEAKALLDDIGPRHAISERATFLVAQLELARGAVVLARPRLEGLLASPDAQLGEDAATLLARSFGSPGERARVWSKYLASSPPSPQARRAVEALCREEPSGEACTLAQRQESR